MLTELIGGLTVTAPPLPPEVVDGADEAQLVAWAGNGCPAAIEQLVGRYESKVFRLARNITGNHEDAEEVVQKKDSEDGEEKTISQELQDWGPNPEQRYSQEELRGILETAISKLAPRYHIVFHLRDIEGFSSKETAQTLHLSLATVKARTRRARLQLRDSLDAYFRPMKGKRKL